MNVSELRQRLEFDAASLPLSPPLSSRLAIDWHRVDAALAWESASPSHYILGQNDAAFPPLLRQIPDPPPVLFVKGAPAVLLQPTIAMVGSRAASHSGLQSAEFLAGGLAQHGFTVASGMAQGIDGACHRGALAAGGTTVAILGTGVDIIYPRQHARLYADIQQSGCVVSELWPDTPAFAGNFPKRNRIIAGISLGTVVIEATRKSGSLISARLAMEQGREVFAVPGNILDDHHRGCHDLLQQGAKLVTDAADILEELEPLLRCQIDLLLGRPHIQSDESQELPYPELLASVEYETTSLDRLVEHSGKPIDLVLEQILDLELQGWVAAVPGGYVRIKRN